MTRHKVLRFISDYIGENGWAPSYREIMNGVGLRSPSVVMLHVHSLERDKLIRFGGGPRMLALTDKGRKSLAEDV